MDEHRVEPGEKVDLDRLDPADTSGVAGSESKARAQTRRAVEKLESLQELLYAEHRHSLLVVLQGMDAAGKDGTIRRVFEGVNPQGVHVACFKQPTPPELDHDFLWRIHSQLPGRGQMVIFNRSHYEDVVAVRVHKLVPKHLLKRRFDEINEFERTITNEGTTVRKFFLHISPEEQIRRLTERLQDPAKHWKFSPTDLAERRYWAKYRRAYQDVLRRTSTEESPWFVVPSDNKWYRDWVVSREIVRTLEGLDMKLPGLSPAARASRKGESWAAKELARRPSD